jgi:hypothetical protein
VPNPDAETVGLILGFADEVLNWLLWVLLGAGFNRIREREVGLETRDWESENGEILRI